MGEENISLPDDLAVQYGFAPASAGETATTKVEAPKEETPEVKTDSATTPPAVEKPAESGVTQKPVETAPVPQAGADALPVGEPLLGVVERDEPFPVREQVSRAVVADPLRIQRHLELEAVAEADCRLGVDVAAGVEEVPRFESQ